MPMPILPIPRFPNVPRAPGVPAVYREIGDEHVTPNPPFVTADAVMAQNGISPANPQWGIYTSDGQLAIVPDSFKDFAYVNEYRVADYPIQAGSFESYNKVATPYDARVVMTKGKSAAERQAFLATLNALVKDTNLYSIVTPERVYIDANLIRYDYERREKNGATLLTVALHLREIRVALPPTFTSTKAPSGADPAIAGTVQPQALTDSQRAIVDAQKAT